ncbi:MAG: Uma2 family endonuclease [Chloroflexota bacterium]|nr:Uma2 family endonuclease [Chloroflexota bacterium]
MAQSAATPVPLAVPPTTALTIPPEVHYDDEALFDFCATHPEWRIERTATGELVLMSPTGGETGRRNALLTAALVVWAEQDGSGVAFDSSTGFRLPDGAVRSPDAAWVLRQRLATLSAEEQQHFLPLCPDFVIELRSATDDLAPLLAKMEAYQANGASLGWLIDPSAQRIYVYRAALPVEQLDAPAEISAAPVLPGFSLSLGAIWASGF